VICVEMELGRNLRNMHLHLVFDISVELIDFSCQVKLKAGVDVIQLLNGTLNPLHLSQPVDCAMVWLFVFFFVLQLFIFVQLCKVNFFCDDSKRLNLLLRGIRRIETLKGLLSLAALTVLLGCVVSGVSLKKGGTTYSSGFSRVHEHRVSDVLNDLISCLDDCLLAVELKVLFYFKVLEIYLGCGGLIQLFQSLDLVFVLQSVQTLEEDVELVLDDDTGEKILKQLDVDIFDSLELQLVEPHDCVLYDLPELLDISDASFNIHRHFVEISDLCCTLKCLAITVEPIEQQSILVDEAAHELLYKLEERMLGILQLSLDQLQLDQELIVLQEQEVLTCLDFKIASGCDRTFPHRLLLFDLLFFYTVHKLINPFA
jgi:hypothetical protein